MIVLGLDPGFASFGWASVYLAPRRRTLIHWGTIETQIDREERVSDDSMRRGRMIAREIEKHFGKRKLDALCVESLQGMGEKTSRAVMIKQGIAYGVVAGVSAVYNVPVYQVSPQTARKLLGLKKKATEYDIRSAVLNHYDVATQRDDITLAAANSLALVQASNHVIDAMAAVVGCEPDLDVQGFLRKRDV